MSGSNLLFIFTGSIAGYKACDVVSRLVQRGHRVRVVATEAALKFVGAATLEGLTGAPVLTNLFAAGAAMEHINLTRWADAVIVCPATANTLNRFAAGLADDLTGALFLAHDRKKPWLMAPAMNPAMWQHPATVAAVEKLKGWGVRFVPVGEGRTACGEMGEGRLAEPAAIVAAVESALTEDAQPGNNCPNEMVAQIGGTRPPDGFGRFPEEKTRPEAGFHPNQQPCSALTHPARRLRVLVTSGGTAEPIDRVRVLTNTSSGRTGAVLTAHLARSGHDVVLLRARTAVAADAGCREEIFFTYAELDAALTRLLGGEHFDAVIHAAAVGDFGIGAVVVGDEVRPPGGAKLESGSAPVLLQLRSHPKLVDSLRARSRNPQLLVVAFKLTDGAESAAAVAAVESLLARSGADFVVHNDLVDRGGGDDFPAGIHQSGGAPVRRCATRTELAARLEQLLLAVRQTHQTQPGSLHAALS